MKSILIQQAQDYIQENKASSQINIKTRRYLNELKCNNEILEMSLRDLLKLLINQSTQYSSTYIQNIFTLITNSHSINENGDFLTKSNKKIEFKTSIVLHEKKVLNIKQIKKAEDGNLLSDFYWLLFADLSDCISFNKKIRIEFFTLTKEEMKRELLILGSSESHKGLICSRSTALKIDGGEHYNRFQNYRNGVMEADIPLKHFKDFNI